MGIKKVSAVNLTKITENMEKKQKYENITIT